MEIQPSSSSRLAPPEQILTVSGMAMHSDRHRKIRALFDDYIERYASRDDRLTTRFSENFGGYTGGGDFLVKDLEQWGFLSVEAQHRCKDGRRIWGEVFSKPDRDEHGAIIGYHGITREITERKRMQDQVQQLALYDSLTKLPNRRLLNDRLAQTLRLMAARLVMARFGGDEFVVMLTELDVGKAKAKSQAEAVAEKIRRKLAGTYSLKLKREGEADALVEHNCSASIGVVMFVDHDARQDDILKWADKAMYQAKDAGRNAVRFYEAEGQH